MQMCWQASPGSRASLRELRIMLLHLHSASRGDPDTASFDLKWNQLMPRQLLPTADDPASHADGSPRSHTVDIDLGTPGSSSAPPAGFESDFAGLNSSSNHIQPEDRDNSSESSPKSPVNEMSLAAELSALDSFLAANDDSADMGNVNESTENSHAAAQINVLAEVHCEKAESMQDDSFNVPLSESMDITDQFSSLNADSAVSPADRYAEYLKTVNTSVSDDAVDLLPSEALEAND